MIVPAIVPIQIALVTVSRVPSMHRPATAIAIPLRRRSRHWIAAMTAAIAHAYRIMPFAAASANGPRARSKWVPTNGSSM